jgi:hypothetical protein
MGPFRIIKEGLRGLRRCLTGEIIQQIDTSIIDNLGVLSLLLKRARRSGDKYVVLCARASGTTWYYSFGLDEFSKFIDASEEARTAQVSVITPSAEPRTLGDYTDLILTGDIVKQAAVPIMGGCMTMTFQLKRTRDHGREYIVLAATARGVRMYYPFELDEFHRFIAGAKEIRAAAQSHGQEASRILRET